MANLSCNRIFSKSIIFTLLFLSSYAFADIHHSRLEKLASDEQWLHLLHYHKVGLLSTYQSQVDDPNFFFSEAGATDPLAELDATLAALRTNQDSAQCRFPARMAWINDKHPGTITKLVTCEKFEKWRDEISAEGLTLIFPAAYLNSPSSMFGHTLMRLDSSKHDNALLDYSVNYAANADPTDNELVFSYKGLTGGYPGVFSVLPYYEKVKEYSYLESRDVWEYQLDIEQRELDQFIRHTWEIKDAHFDYFFFTENCSYHLLTLLDAASERFDLADEFTTNVIPSDTVRVLSQAGLIRKANFRPSSLARLQAMKDEMSDEQIQAAKQRVTDNSNSLDTFNDHEQAQILDLAYRYTRYLALKEKDQSRDLAKTTLGLLSQRSKLETDEAFSPHPIPDTRDDEGHRSHRHQFSYGYDQQNYLEYGLRMSYHDWLDPIAGYIPGARLEIIHAKIRYQTKDERLQLQNFRAIDIASLSPRDDFFKPLSWFVSTGLKRPNYANQELLPYLTAGPGLSYGSDKALFSLLWSNELNIDSDIDKGYFLGSGPRAVWLWQDESWSVALEWQHHFDVAGSEFKAQHASLGISKQINSDWQLRIEGRYERFLDAEGAQSQTGSSSLSNNTSEESSGSISINRYF